MLDFDLGSRSQLQVQAGQLREAQELSAEIVDLVIFKFGSHEQLLSLKFSIKLAGPSSFLIKPVLATFHFCSISDLERDTFGLLFMFLHMFY